MVDRVHAGTGTSKVSTQGIREARTAAATVVGTVKELQFGKKVIYAYVGAAAISAGSCMCAPAVVANHRNRMIAVTASVGAKQVTITIGATSAAADLYEDAMLIITSGQGSGYSYMVAGHKPWASSSTAAVIDLKDGLEVAAVTTSQTLLCQNKARGVVVSPNSASLTGAFVGVALISAAANSYVWLGHKGEWPVLMDAGTLVGGPVQVGGTATATGQVGPITISSGQTIVGVCMSTATDTGYGLVDFV